MTYLLYRDHAAWSKSASASTASKLNLPNYIRKDFTLHDRDFEAALNGRDKQYYNLCTLCESAGVPLTGEDEEDASRFIKHCTGSREYNCHSDKIVKQWEALPDLFCTTKQRPDIWILEGEDRRNVVILVAEVHSGKGPEGYRETLNKEVIGLMTQLRMLRYQYNINQVVGFVLPNSSEPFFVTKVTVRFEELYFYYAFQRVSSWKDVKASVKAGYQVNKDAIGQLGPSLNSGDIRAYPIKLTEAELGDLSNAFHLQEGVIMKQLQSWNSFILQGDNGKVYKFCLNKQNYTNTALFTFTIKKLQHEKPRIDRLLLHEQELPVFNLDNPFLQFPAAIPPLSASEARKCLVALLRSTKEAIDQLHSFNYAHLDIRLPNICFRNDGEKVYAVLIDFERVTNNIGSDAIPKYHSCLYRFLEGRLTCGQCDFMQLGWMAVWILHFNDALAGYDPHNLDTAWEKGRIPSNTKEDPFIKELVQYGKFLDQHLDNSKIFRDSQQSLKEVLKIRTISRQSV